MAKFIFDFYDDDKDGKLNKADFFAVYFLCLIQ